MGRFLFWGVMLLIIVILASCANPAAPVAINDSSTQIGTTGRCTVSVIKDNENQRLIYVVQGNYYDTVCGISVQYNGP